MSEFGCARTVCVLSVVSCGAQCGGEGSTLKGGGFRGASRRLQQRVRVGKRVGVELECLVPQLLPRQRHLAHNMLHATDLRDALARVRAARLELTKPLDQLALLPVQLAQRHQVLADRPDELPRAVHHGKLE
jgi:hypothetical protein